MRWVRWTSAAAGMGIASSLSAPVTARGHALGAMKVYSPRAHEYDERDERVLQMFADQAAIMLSNVLEFTDARNTIAQLKEAIETRDVIGMAKGILMSREGVDPERALEMLRTASQGENVKLRDIAPRLVGSGSPWTTVRQVALLAELPDIAAVDAARKRLAYVEL